MKRLGITILLTTLCQLAFCQFAVIYKVASVNVKSSTNVGSNTFARLSDGAVVYCIRDEDDGWLSVNWELGKLNKSGFIPQSSVKRIDSLAKVPCRNLGDEIASWSADSVDVTITTTPFDPTPNKLLFGRGTSLSSSSALLKINGKDYWGTDGSIPKIQYGNIMVHYGHKRIYLPIDNLFEPNLKNTKVFHDWSTRTLYVSALNGEGAGRYMVLWVVENGIVKSRTLTNPF